MTHSPPNVRIRDRVQLSWDHGEGDAVVTLASENARSLFVRGEFIIAGFVGMVPLSWSEAEGDYFTLNGARVRLQILETIKENLQ